MNVQKIINQASSKITGISDPEPEDVRLFLDCLNQAHFELWDIATDFYNDRYKTVKKIGEDASWTEDGILVEGCLKVYEAWLNTPKDIKPISQIDFIKDYEKNGIIIFGSKPTVYSVLQTPKSCLIYLAPLPMRPYRQPMLLQYAKHPPELFLNYDQDVIPYSPSTILKLVQGTCAKAIESNLGSSSKQDYAHYINDWEHYKTRFREECYAKSYKDRTKTYRYV